MDQDKNGLSENTKEEHDFNTVEDKCAFLLKLADRIRNWKIPTPDPMITSEKTVDADDAKRRCRNIVSYLTLQHNFRFQMEEILRWPEFSVRGELLANLKHAYNTALEYSKLYDSTPRKCYEDQCELRAEFEGCLWGLAGLLNTLERQLRYDNQAFTNDIKPAETHGEGNGKQSKRKRSTQQEIDNQNRAVMVAAIELKGQYDRLPTVSEIADRTGYKQKAIYKTSAYDEGKIARKSAKLTSESTGASIKKSEYFEDKTIEGSRARRRTRAEQAELDAMIDAQQADDKSDFVK